MGRAIARLAPRNRENQWANELLQQTAQSLDSLLQAHDERIKRSKQTQEETLQAVKCASRS
uniref:hypothetical protein n=1 Tax=Trichocoleus desertorum TaxID=1481672 RepID=UPI0025B4F9CD|nr:hypothetical protein [Trichocoleus desertorum]